MSYKEHWAYKEVAKNYKIEVSDTRVRVLFDDGDAYVDFRLEKDDDPDPRYNVGYFIYLDEIGVMINDELDFYKTFDEAVSSCLYYFHTRF